MYMLPLKLKNDDITGHRDINIMHEDRDYKC